MRLHGRTSLKKAVTNDIVFLCSVRMFSWRSAIAASLCTGSLVRIRWHVVQPMGRMFTSLAQPTFAFELI